MYPTELGVNQPRPDRTGFFTGGDPTESGLSQKIYAACRADDTMLRARARRTYMYHGTRRGT